jgi:hypothetical protein
MVGRTIVNQGKVVRPSRLIRGVRREEVDLKILAATPCEEAL